MFGCGEREPLLRMGVSPSHGHLFFTSWIDNVGFKFRVRLKYWKVPRSAHALTCLIWVLETSTSKCTF